MTTLLPPTLDAVHFHAALPQTGALIGLDLGTKTIGVALSDGGRVIGSAMLTIRRVKFTPDAQALIKLATENAVVGYILGYPLNMDGSEGPRAQSTRAFARSFQNLAELPILFWDERLSTVAAERMLIEADRSRKRRAEVIDKTAAAIILQGALDRLAAIGRMQDEV